MQKNIFFACFLLLILVFSVSAIQASDVNQTDLEMSDSNAEVPLEHENQGDVGETDSTSDDDKNQTDLASKSTEIYYKGNYEVVLKDTNTSSAISNRTVSFVINNVSYNATTDGDGIAGIKLDLDVGKYIVNVSFKGDDVYNNCSLSDNIEVKSPIKAGDVTKYYKGSAKFTAQFFNTDGSVMAGKTVTVSVNGKVYTVNTNADGIVALPVDLKPGSYKIVSTNPITGFKLTTTFTILSTIGSAKVKKVEGEKFTVKFFKSDGKPLAKKTVTIKFKVKKYKVKTNSKGIAGLSMKKVKKGTYKIVCYNVDGLSKTFKVKVYKRKASTKLTAKSYTFFPDDDKKIKVKLSTALGDTSNAGKTVKMKVSGKTYSKKTDADGVVCFDLSSLKKGIYTVTYNYGGNKYFKSSKSTKSLTIFDTNKTKITVKSTTHFGYGAGTSLKVAYTAGGVPLVKKSVTLTIAGKTYTKTTDSNGMVSVPINLKIGDYVVDYKTDNESKLVGTSGSFDIDVFKRSPSKIVWKCGSSYKDNLQTFKVLVTNSKGNHVSGGQIELTIDGETYHAKVSSGGYAKFKSEVAIGKYKVSVKYKGNNNYLPSSNSKSVNVELSKFGNGLNERNARALAAYLKSSSHCKVGDKKIKKLVKSLTKGLTNDVDKAKAIFNYVRDTLKYDYYYNTWHGAVGTLNHKSGNCVDHSHLLVSMYRTAGFSARYVHGRCHFSDMVTGHVWVQVKIGKKWVCADAVSSKNSLGKIKNWNTKSYTVHAKYASLPF